MQPGVHTRGPGLHGVGEPEGHVSQGDDEVCPDDWLHGPLQDSEQQLEMTLTKLAGDQHELGEREAGAGPQVGVRELTGVGANVEDQWSDGCQESVAVQKLLLADLGKDSVSTEQIWIKYYISDELRLGIVSFCPNHSHVVILCSSLGSLHSSGSDLNQSFIIKATVTALPTIEVLFFFLASRSFFFFSSLSFFCSLRKFLLRSQKDKM